MSILAFPVPGNESERLRILNALDLGDTRPDPAFDAICLEVAKVFEAPIALITLVDKDRQWFKSRVGLSICETSREHSFCNYVIVQDDVLIIPDASKDARFADNPLVVGPPQIRFYAGAPLYYGDGIRLGALCIIDQRPRLASEVDVATLQQLADRVAGEIWLRQAAHDPDYSTTSQEG